MLKALVPLLLLMIAVASVFAYEMFKRPITPKTGQPLAEPNSLMNEVEDQPDESINRIPNSTDRRIGNDTPKVLIKSTDRTNHEEQLFIYELNMLRRDPKLIGQLLGIDIDLSDVSRRPPLAIDTSLAQAAQFKAKEMADDDYMQHQSQVTGKWPNALAREFGFDLPKHFPQDVNNIESICAGYSSPRKALDGLIVDEGVPSLGHRIHLLGCDDFNKSATRIGVGYSASQGTEYKHYWSVLITHREVEMEPSLTGVVYDDRNGNGRFDLKEGVSHATLTLNNSQIVECNESGGWTCSMPPGVHTLVWEGDQHRLSKTIELDAENRYVEVRVGEAIKVDFESIMSSLSP